jgi:hypothetical protein
MSIGDRVYFYGNTLSGYRRVEGHLQKFDTPREGDVFAMFVREPNIAIVNEDGVLHRIHDLFLHRAPVRP